MRNRHWLVVSDKRLMEGSVLSSAALTAVQSGIVMLLVLALLPAQGGPSALIVDAEPGFRAVVGFLSLFCTIGAFYVHNAAVRRSSPTRVSFLMGTGRCSALRCTGPSCPRPRQVPP